MGVGKSEQRKYRTNDEIGNRGGRDNTIKTQP